MVLQYITTWVAGIIIAFIYGWKLTLVILSVMPLIFFSGMIMGKSVAAATSGGQKHYARAGHIADEILRMIRTIIAFDTQDQVMWMERNDVLLIVSLMN